MAGHDRLSPFDPVSPTGYSYSLHSHLNTSGPDNGNQMTTEEPSFEENCFNRSYIPGMVSKETFIGIMEFSQSYSHLHGYVSTAVCLFGLMSNTANIIVLTRKNMISSTNTILMWLAVADLLTMMSYLPFAIHFYLMREPGLRPFATRSLGWILFLMFHASFSIVCHTVAIWLTIALAIFRYIYICLPPGEHLLQPAQGQDHHLHRLPSDGGGVHAQLLHQPLRQQPPRPTHASSQCQRRGHPRHRRPRGGRATGVRGCALDRVKDCGGRHTGTEKRIEERMDEWMEEDSV
ncbi:hypothetical protein C0Q70_09562 [Pomacea canaliculata]|uniref:G-protein coupled receptors family 1 profile domain-containing protein n=1 Tax=Pomacea canaliculata TaxID=400727 RepID=A0A2T7PA57_POMCA|nr:hypothetical protein C0Q70_09562 [Pomacea canaliculata]